jgi:hypothetical protein
MHLDYRVAGDPSFYISKRSLRCNVTAGHITDG